MPAVTDKLETAREEAEDGELPYISKSRLTTYVKCPRKFWYQYILGIRGPENDHMRKGTRIHETFEDYYANVIDHYTGEFVDYELPEYPRDLVRFLPDDADRYADWLEHIGSFIAWELERAENATTLREWLPVAVEAEAWDNDQLVPWMGFADVIVPAASVPAVEEDEGVVIVDFKTGKTPDEKYRDKGIYLEGEYYGMLFKDEYDVVGVAGYFPQKHNFVVSPLKDERRDFIREKVAEIHLNGEEKQKFPTSTGPLCQWGPGEDDRCDHYSLCHDGQDWGKPTENWDEFVNDVGNGMGYGQLLGKYYDGDDPHDSLGYWKWKAGQ